MTTEAEVIAGLRKALRDARRIISATHKNPVVHTNCEVHNCPICDGGLFQCADCGAAEIETETRVCSVALQAPQEAGVKALDDDQIMEIIKEIAPWKNEPQLNDLLTYEKSPPLFPQATYDVPSYRATNFVRAVERRICSALSQPVATPAPSQDAAVAWRCERQGYPEGYPGGNGRWHYFDGPPNPSHLAKNVQPLFTRPAEAQDAAVTDEPTAFLIERLAGAGYGSPRSIVDAAKYDPRRDDFWVGDAKTRHLVTPLYAAARPAEAQAVAEGLAKAIAFVRKRCDDYVAEHGSYDPETGATEFPGNGDEYVGELEEIIEGLKALAASPATGGA